MKKIFIITTLFATVLFGCEDWVDVNTDPNNPSEVPPSLVLPVAQHFTAVHLQEDRGVNHLGNMFMYNWSESGGFSWYNDEFLYLVTSTFYAEIFDYSYTNGLNQYEAMIGLGDEYMAYEGIAKIMKTYHYQLLVDFYGDVPYFEALGRGTSPTPAYDDAQEIYDDLIVELTEAITMLDSAESVTGAVLPADDDAIFGGDLDSWKQFANSIKIRILTRESDTKSATYIQAELDAIASEGSGFFLDDVLVNPGYANQEDQQTPLWETFGWSVTGSPTLTNDATCATDYILDYLANTADPRIDYLYEKPATGHRGVPQGITSDPADDGADAVSNIGEGILQSYDMGANIYSLAELYFNMAELAQKGFTGLGDAQTNYESGIEASGAYLGVSDSAMAVYIAQGLDNVSFAGSSDKLEAIITQKWLAVNGITAEQSWFDWSRTGYPAGLPVSVEQPNLVRPVRLLYPASEVGGNPNMPAQSNAFTDKIFWAN